MQPVFDGHNDVLYALWKEAARGEDIETFFLTGERSVSLPPADRPFDHIDLPRARKGGLAGGFCAIFVLPAGARLMDELTREQALPIARDMAGIAKRIEKAGGWTLCTSVSDIRAAMAAETFAAVLHMEGCEAIGPDIDGLAEFYAAGLRSLGPLWSRRNVFGHGAPLRNVADPDCGPGLTDAGKALVRACDRMGILVDTAHLTEKGFWDVAEVSGKPLVATHSNAHAVTQVARNLTDRQLDAIRERRGVVGLNFAVTMIGAGGQEGTNVPVESLVRHLDHMVARVGIDGVALGSDFNGARIPDAIGDAAGLPVLVEALTKRYGPSDLEKLCRENWLRVLGETWGEA
ncbi:MAG: dipeptidase [Rhizobiaceae bacterium]